MTVESKAAFNFLFSVQRENGLLTSAPAVTQSRCRGMQAINGSLSLRIISLIHPTSSLCYRPPALPAEQPRAVLQLRKVLEVGPRDHQGLWGAEEEGDVLLKVFIPKNTHTQKARLLREVGCRFSAALIFQLRPWLFWWEENFSPKSRGIKHQVVRACLLLHVDLFRLFLKSRSPIVSIDEHAMNSYIVLFPPTSSGQE